MPADPGRLQRPRSCSPKPGLSVSVPPSPDREYGEPTLRPQSETLFLVEMTSPAVRPPRQPCHDIIFFLVRRGRTLWLGSISKAPFYGAARALRHASVRGGQGGNRASPFAGCVAARDATTRRDHVPVVVTTEGGIMSVWVTDTDPGPFGLWLPDGYSTTVQQHPLFVQ